MFDSLLNEARSVLQNAVPAEVADAARDHVDETDPNTLQQHLTSAAQGMSGPALAQLGSAILAGLAQHGTTETQLKDAGVPVENAAQGDQESVLALIAQAAQNPAGLRTGVVQLVEQHPQVLTQLPGLVQGLMQKLRG